MPEWPDLHVLRERLETALVGRKITAVRVGDPVVIRATRPLDEILLGRSFTQVRHRGKFLLFSLDSDVSIVVNPMLAGLFLLARPELKATKDTRLSLALDDGSELRYRDDVRMGKIYVLEGDAPERSVPGYGDLGPDADDLGGFRERAKKRGGEVRNLLMDQRVIAGIGNAYADEILYEAKLHPKRAVRSLSAKELSVLEDAIAKVIARGVDEVEAGMPPELGTKVRGHLRVRGREGSPCPRCGSPIKRTRKGDDETYLCTACQPPPAGVLR